MDLANVNIANYQGAGLCMGFGGLLAYLWIAYPTDKGTVRRLVFQSASVFMGLFIFSFLNLVSEVVTHDNAARILQTLLRHLSVLFFTPFGALVVCCLRL
jgi:hypothetical protein